MQRTYIDALEMDKVQKVQGFVEAIRDQKSMQFIILKDITGKIQITVDKNAQPEIAEIFSHLTVQSVITVEGNVIENKAVKVGGKELLPTSVVVESVADNLPINEETNLDMRLDYRWLDLRSEEKTLIFQIGTEMEKAMREYFYKNNFIEIHSPKIISTPSESGAELFSMKYFGQQAYLAQSPQFYKQMAMASGFDKIFEVGPVFRANPSFTSRHDTEFTMLDVEMSYIDNHEQLMQFEENWLVYVLTKIKEKYGEKIKEMYGAEIVIPKVPFPRIPMAEAEKILLEMGHELPPANKGDLDSVGEKLLAQYVKEKYGHEFVFVTDYNTKVRPFYHHRDPKTGLTMSYDLLFKGLEITTGAVREHKYDVLLAQTIEKGLSVKNTQFYLDFFKYGCPPHGGFGFGLSRLLMLILNISNVREVTYIYRGPTRLKP